MSLEYPTGLVTTRLCCGDVILDIGGGKMTCEGDGAAPGLPSLCDSGVPIRGEGCIGDILAFCWLLGLCITLDIDPGPGECETTGAGLCNGELCCIIGEAEGDIMGDCEFG